MYLFPCRCATLYLSPRQTTGVLLRFCKFKKKKKKKKKCGNMGKNIKSYAIVPTLHSPGKGWKPHGKKVSVHQLKQKNGLTIHSWVLPSSKFTGKILLFKKLFFFW